MDQDDAPSSPTPRPARQGPRTNGSRPASAAPRARRTEGATTRAASSGGAPRPAKRRPASTMVVDVPIDVPDAPVSDEPIVLPVIVPAEPAVDEASPAPAQPPRADPRALRADPDLPTEAVPAIVPAAPTGESLFTPPDGEAATVDFESPAAAPRPRAAPVMFRRRRPRVRRVTRVVRHVDTWSVFKVALVFNLFVYVTLLVAGVLLWQVAHATGTVDNVENFFLGFGWESFELKGGEIYHNAWIAGLFLTVGLTGLAVFAATLFNLITDLVGGIRVSVLEEEVVVRSERSLLPRVRRDVDDEDEPPLHGQADAAPTDPG